MQTIDALRLTLTAYPTEYARGRACEAALEAFASPRDVLASLALASEATPAARDAVTLALIAQHQRGPHPLWQSLLLVAYEPMFAGVKKRLYDKRDADARILAAFLEAIAQISIAYPPFCLALDLRRSVERSVFGTGAAAHEEPETISIQGDAREVPSDSSPEAYVALEEQKRLLLAELDDLFGAEASEVLHVLLRARTGREQLVALVAELYPECTSKERAVAYARLQSLRRRALAHLEERFTSPSRSSAA